MRDNVYIFKKCDYSYDVINRNHDNPSTPSFVRYSHLSSTQREWQAMKHKSVHCGVRTNTLLQNHTKLISWPNRSMVASIQQVEYVCRIMQWDIHINFRKWINDVCNNHNLKYFLQTPCFH